MNRIDALFQQVRERGRPAFAAYVTAGDPDLARTNAIVHALVEAGVELIEYGVPFSDPIADGPVIQRAALRSLKGGTTVSAILKSLRSLRDEGCEAAISLFGAYNPFLHRGLETICREARDAGADGLLIPDLPPDEASELRRLVGEHDLRLTFLLAPTSNAERVRLVTDACTGYVYCVSLRGVTGERDAIPADLEAFLSRTREATDKPLLVGFGISKPEHAPDLPERAAALARSLIDAMPAQARA
jgi:tryptophan synthase alpha chain